MDGVWVKLIQFLAIFDTKIMDHHELIASKEEVELMENIKMKDIEMEKDGQKSQSNKFNKQ